ncbi:hypothetical protein [Streptomyces spiralis]|uniref:hypothetical protein n=1 Tax=Streptomyces spiralis TaxID=66376 RepID=UPI0036A9C73D
MIGEASLDRGLVRTRLVPGTSHYPIIVGDEGARVVAQHLLAAAGVVGTEGPRATPSP